MAYALFQIQAEWEFVSGKFAPREAIIEALLDEVGDPGDLDVDEGTYSIVTWEVEEVEQTKPLSRAKLVDKLVPACAVLGITDKRKIEQFIDLYRSSGGNIS